MFWAACRGGRCIVCQFSWHSFALAGSSCHETQAAFRPQMAGQRVVRLCRHPALILRTRPRYCSPARHNPEGGIMADLMEGGSKYACGGGTCTKSADGL